MTATDKQVVKKNDDTLLESTIKSYTMAKEGITEILPKAKKLHSVLNDKKDLDEKQSSEKAQLKKMITKIQGRIPGLDEVPVKTAFVKTALY